MSDSKLLSPLSLWLGSFITRVLFVGTACAIVVPAQAQQEDEWEEDDWEKKTEKKQPVQTDAKQRKSDVRPKKDAQARQKKAEKKGKARAKTAANVEEGKGPTAKASTQELVDPDDDTLSLRLGANVGLYLESGAIRDDVQIEALRDNHDEEYDAGLEPSVMLQLWFPLSDLFHVSSGLRYGGVYTVSTGENENDVFGFGHQLEAHVGVEAWIDTFAGIDVVVGLRGGLGVIFPTDELDEEITLAQGQGADAWSTPRLGLLFGPLAGARWAITETVAIRGEVAVSFGRYFLFNYSGDISGVYYERSAIANFTRYEFSAGLEISLGSL